MQSEKNHVRPDRPGFLHEAKAKAMAMVISTISESALDVLAVGGVSPQHPCHIKEEGGSYGSPPPPPLPLRPRPKTRNSNHLLKRFRGGEMRRRGKGRERKKYVV